MCATLLPGRAQTVLCTSVNGKASEELSQNHTKSNEALTRIGGLCWMLMFIYCVCVVHWSACAWWCCFFNTRQISDLVSDSKVSIYIFTYRGNALTVPIPWMFDVSPKCLRQWCCFNRSLSASFNNNNNNNTHCFDESCLSQCQLHHDGLF